MRRLVLLFLFVAVCAGAAVAQGDIDTEKKILFRNEWSIGTVVKTNGLEMDYRSGKFVNVYKKNLFDVGFGFIKHPQQYRTSNQYITGYGTYCFGKKNFCMEFFGSWGRQRTLFQKADLNSVEIRMFYFGGVDLALLKPIYYEIYHSSSDVRSELFDPVNHYANITLGTSEFTKGFDQISVVPGANVKVGLSVEYGRRDTKLTALEAGIKFTAFAKELDIMAQERNQQFITSLFITFRFGRVKHGAQYDYLNDYED